MGPFDSIVPPEDAIDLIARVRLGQHSAEASLVERAAFGVFDDPVIRALRPKYAIDTFAAIALTRWAMAAIDLDEMFVGEAISVKTVARFFGTFGLEDEQREPLLSRMSELVTEKAPVETRALADFILALSTGEARDAGTAQRALIAELPTERTPAPPTQRGMVGEWLRDLVLQHPGARRYLIYSDDAGRFVRSPNGAIALFIELGYPRLWRGTLGKPLFDIVNVIADAVIWLVQGESVPSVDYSALRPLNHEQDLAMRKLLTDRFINSVSPRPWQEQYGDRVPEVWLYLARAVKRVATTAGTLDIAETLERFASLNLEGKSPAPEPPGAVARDKGAVGRLSRRVFLLVAPFAVVLGAVTGFTLSELPEWLTGSLSALVGLLLIVAIAVARSNSDLSNSRYPLSLSLLGGIVLGVLYTGTGAVVTAAVAYDWQLDWSAYGIIATEAAASIVVCVFALRYPGGPRVRPSALVPDNDDIPGDVDKQLHDTLDEIVLGRAESD